MSTHNTSSGFYVQPLLASGPSPGACCSRNLSSTTNGRGGKSYPRTTYSMQAPPSSSSLTIQTNEGVAIPNASGVIEITGAGNSGLMTRVQANNSSCISNRIEFQNLRDITPYVVNNNPDSDNQSEYTSLHDALVAANQDPVSDPCTAGGVVVILTSSKHPYMLTDALTTNRRISITSAAKSNGSVFLESDGMVESYGNKTWSGVIFRGDCTHYHLTSSKVKPQVEDKFNSWTEFTENAKVSTDNHMLNFRNVHFNHSQLTRDAVLEANGGCGAIDACFCKFNVSRCGKTDARSFIRHCVDDNESETRILHSYGEVEAEGREPFNFADLQGSQLFRFEHNTFVWNKAQPTVTAMFGTTLTEEGDDDDHCPTPVINGNARLEVGHSTVHSPNQQNLTLIHNIATGARNVGLTLLFSHVRAKHIYMVDAKVPEGQASGLYAHNSFLAGVSNAPLFLVNHSDNNDFEYRVVATPHQTFSSASIYRFNQSGTGNNVQMYTQAFHMLHFGLGASPISIEGNIDTTNVDYESVGASSVAPAVGVNATLLQSAIV